MTTIKHMDAGQVCGHEGCHMAFHDDDALRAHREEHREACLDISIHHANCGFCGVTKDDQIDAYLSDEPIDHPFADPDLSGEDNACSQCAREIAGRQVTKCGSLYPDAVFCSVSCLRDFVAGDFGDDD